jgi:dienelactone hydrolase
MTTRNQLIPRASRRRAVAALVGALLAVTIGSAPASATIVERDRFSEPYKFVTGFCGYPMTVEGVETHDVLVRANKKVDGIVFVTDNYAFQETWTAPDGRWFTLSANALGKDVKAKPLGGSLYQFTFKQPGQPQVVTDSSGRVVARDRGNLSFDYTIDLADDAFEFLGVRISGPHVGFETDLCKLVQPLTGTDSARYQTLHPIGSTTSPMGFAEYLPPSYHATGAKSPLLVFLHGYGETGDGTPEAIENLLFGGIPRFIDVGGWSTDRPFVVLSPQHVEEAPGFPFEDCNASCNMFLQHERDHASPAFCTTPDEVHAFLGYALAHYNVDPSRVYVTGLSCGGFGTWEYLAKYGDEYAAAAIPIAGEGRPAWTDAGCDLGSVALWAFHGELDDVVDPAGSIEPMTNLAGCPGIDPDRAKLTVYEGLFHEGWDEAYSGSLGDDIYTWMLGITKA